MPSCETTRKSNYVKAVQLTVSYVEANGIPAMRELLRTEFKVKKVSEMTDAETVRFIEMVERNHRIHHFKLEIVQPKRFGLTPLIKKLKGLMK